MSKNEDHLNTETTKYHDPILMRVEPSCMEATNPQLGDLFVWEYAGHEDSDAILYEKGWYKFKLIRLPKPQENNES